MSISKRHHYIPEFFIKGFAGEDHKVSVYDIEKGKTIIVTLLTWGILTLEVILFAGFFMKIKHRKKLLIIGMLFHLGIVVVHGLFSFFFAMAAALILYLWPVHQTFKMPSRFKKATKIVTHKGEHYLPFTFKTEKLK